MDTKLAKTFVQRGVIRQGTILEAYQSARGLSCVCDSYSLTRYVVLGATATPDHVFFEVVSSSTERLRVRCDYVASIDGMAVKRVAAAHQLQENGDPLLSASRRGRKRRRFEEMLTLCGPTLPLSAAVGDEIISICRHPDIYSEAK